MVLLELLCRSGKKLKVLHVNYGLRGEASEADEALIREVCFEKGIALSVLNVNLYEELKLHGGNLQQKARDRRYAFFEEHTASEDGLFMAHHLDDQIETFFLALGRGGGIRSLACMPEKKGIFCRPLLSVTKERLRQYAAENNVRWREDQSNQGLGYSRNKWRNVFLPQIEKSFPVIRTEVPFLVSCFQEKLNEIQIKANEFLESFRESHVIPFDWFKLDGGDVVAELLRTLMFSHGLKNELRKLIRANKGARLALSHESFRMVYREEDHFYFSVDLNFELPTIGIEPVTSLPDQFDKWTIYLNPEKIKGNLRLRHWQKGDRIKPIGVRGSKLISDILSDAKVPSHQKSDQWVLHDDEKILWCVGHAVSIEAIAARNTKKMKVCLTKLKCLVPSQQNDLLDYRQVTE